MRNKHKEISELWLLLTCHRKDRSATAKCKNNVVVLLCLLLCPINVWFARLLPIVETNTRPAAAGGMLTMWNIGANVVRAHAHCACEGGRSGH